MTNRATRIDSVLVAFPLFLIFCSKLAAFQISVIADPVTGKPIEVVSDRIIVKFRDSTNESRRAALRFSGAAQISAALPSIQAEVLNVSSGSLLSTLDQFKKMPEVEFAEPDYIRKTSALAFNDTFIAFQYGLTNCKITDAWVITTGTATQRVNVAVLDTGVDYTHPDLGRGFGGTVYDGYDFVNENSDPMDDHGHGTFVSGIIAATSNNGLGIAGISGGAKILAVKVCDSGGSCPTSAVIAGVEYATAKGVNVINLSLGGAPSSVLEETAFRKAIEARITVVAAAGNDGNGVPVNYPAAYQNVIAVGASDSSDGLASFSNTGAAVLLVAPGVSVVSTLPGSLYGINDGTSFSSPHVAGIAALMLSIQPRLTPGRIARILAQTADDLGAPGLDDSYGYGRVNAVRALNAIPSQLIAPPEDQTVPMPNPFISKGMSTVTFRIPANLGSQVSAVRIVNALGVPVRALSGTNVWDGKNEDGNYVAGGVYYYVLETPQGKSRNKVFVVR